MKINIKTHKNRRTPLIIKDIPVLDEDGIIVSTKRFDMADSLIMLYVNDSDANRLSIGDAVFIDRYMNGKNICSSETHVVNVINNIVSIDKPSSSGSFYIMSVSNFSDNGVLYYRLTLDRPHHLIQNDLLTLEDASVSLIDTNRGVEVKIRDFFVKNNTNDNGEDYVIYLNTGELYSGNVCAPESSGMCIPEVGMVIETEYNPYYYLKDGEYHLWGDEDENSDVKFSIGNAFLNLQVGISDNTDFATLRQHESVTNIFNGINKRIVPDVIDMEKTKYIPYLCVKNGETVEPNGLAEKIEFNLHFRTRVKKENSYAPTSRWTIQTEENTANGSEQVAVPIDAWNNFVDYTDIPQIGSDAEYLLYQSDLVGNLGFTDQDVLNRRSKISKSFLRLSFYNSNDPLQTTMLFYSTIFMDSAELYSKYIKLKTNQSYQLWEDEYYTSIEDGDRYDNDWGLVFFDGQYNGEEVIANEELLTCKMTVTGEFDRLHSAEGYNLYLFADDAPGEDESRTIYMKIEFNHAGYGRTIPLLMWPRDEVGNPVGLTRDNYYNALYIPVEVMFNKETMEYIYYIKDAKNDIENNKITFSLFEPKFEPSVGQKTT